MERCPWCLGNEKMIRYHDEEWGVLVYDGLFDRISNALKKRGLKYMGCFRYSHLQNCEDINDYWKKCFWHQN